MDWLTSLFSNHQTTAYTVAVYAAAISFGIMLGKIKIANISLGVSGVLFTSLLLSYLGVTLNTNVLDFLKEFGLLIFIYTIGLQIGNSFFASLHSEGLKMNSLALILIICGVLTTVAIHLLSETPISAMIGIMSGSITNTPGLGAAQQALSYIIHEESELKHQVSNLAAGCAVAYPFGVIGSILILILFRILFRININSETRVNNRKLSGTIKKCKRYNIEVSNPLLWGSTIQDLKKLLNIPFVISRIYQNGTALPAEPDTIIQEGCVLLVDAKEEDIAYFRKVIGKDSPMDLFNMSDVVASVKIRKIRVTQKNAYSKNIGNLDIMGRYGVVITRVMRAGIEFIPNEHTRLQFGDTIMAIGEEKQLDTLANVFGNSEKQLRTPQIAGLFLGILLGVLLGIVPIYIPGLSVPVKLGLAGGPLVAAILVSRFGRSFSINNYISTSANQMLREIGIALFLASIGLASGEEFAAALTSGNGMRWLFYGVLITAVPLGICFIIGRVFYKLNYLELCGILAGSSTNPTTLAYISEQSGTDTPATAYATVYPLTTFFRIMAAQILILLFA